MKPFRLITVERLHSRRLEAVAQELHTVSAARDHLVAERDRLIMELASGGRAAAVGMYTGADLDMANNFRQVLRQMIEDQNEQILSQEEVIAQVRAAWLSARTDLRAVEVLHERHRVAVRAEQARADQRELDELAGTRRASLRDVTADDEADPR
jgi:flagellar FliJ protein